MRAIRVHDHMQMTDLNRNDVFAKMFDSLPEADRRIVYELLDEVVHLDWFPGCDEMTGAGGTAARFREQLLDTFEGLARFSITPLTIYDVRPAFLPAVPYFSWLHELNVRTYVHFEGVPGVWFFSLDANNLAAVLGARFFFELPYYSANIILEANDDRVTFKSARSDRKARFAAEWEIGKSLPPAVPGSLDFFLVERYSLYTADDLNIYRCRIHHKPWPLQETRGFSNYHSTMAEIAGLPTPAEDPMLHCGGPVNVDVWPLEKIADRS